MELNCLPRRVETMNVYVASPPGSVGADVRRLKLDTPHSKLRTPHFVRASSRRLLQGWSAGSGTARKWALPSGVGNFQPAHKCGPPYWIESLVALRCCSPS